MISSEFLAVSPSELLDTSEDMELKQRLGLYQVFLKLYEHHRGLLDEILELENSGNKSLPGVILPYIQASLQNGQAQLVTNLLGGKSQALIQPQQMWTIGRDSGQVVLPIPDKRLSRCHAAIQYIDNQGFYLVDLNSSNGSFVNGERVRQPQRLRDGDRIRVGSLTIVFFLCDVVQHLEPLSAEMQTRLEQIESAPQEDPGALETSLDSEQSSSTCSPEETLLFLKSNLWKPSTPPTEN